MTKFWQWLARRLPKTLIYFCTIELWAHVTTHEYRSTAVYDVTIDQALRSYAKDWDLE